MHCYRNSSFFTIPSADSILKLTAIDTLFIDQFNTMDDRTKLKTIKEKQPGFIFRLAIYYPELETFCQDLRLSEYWNLQWQDHGIQLAKKTSINPVILLPQNEIQPFDLGRGMHFLIHSIDAKQALNKSFGYSEKKFITLAIEYHSIHALIRYASYQINKIYQSTDLAKAEHRYSKLVDKFQNALPAYKSYAYMILADVTHLFSRWLSTKKRVEECKRWHEAALVYIDMAEQLLPESEACIHNASLGMGLKLSNLHRAETPAKFRDWVIKEYVMDSYRERFAELNKRCGLR